MYVVKSFPFTDDITQAVSDLQKQHANGGGDFPEAVEQGLQAAIEQQSWSDASTAKLLFLVLDAPPHQTKGAIESLQHLTKTAAAKGIRVIPVTASGIDKDTEMLTRFIDVATGGTYVFLTDDSGIGGGHLDPHPTIGDYDVELLNNLLVRLINERL
jgi:hypothetical protein